MFRQQIPLLLLSLTSQTLAQESGSPGPHETITVGIEGGEHSTATQANTDAAEQGIVDQTNAFRRRQGRDALEVNDALAQAAQKFARYMAETGRYGHQADGRTPVERVVAAGYEYCAVRENIAYAFRSDGFSTDRLIENFVTGWKESPGHRRNMLARHVTETGVSIAKSEQGTYFAVQLFARPKSAAVAFEVQNQSPLTVSYRLGDREFSLSPRMTRTHRGCQPRTVKFLPVETDEEASDPPEPVERLKVTGGERLTVRSSDGSYRVTVEGAERPPT